MAERVPELSNDARLADVLDALHDIAAGDLQRRLPISDRHDQLDAIAHAINVLGGELDYMTRRLSRAREQAEQASTAKTEFLRNVSHELRTPLSAILGAAQLIQKGRLVDPRGEGLLAKVESNVHAQSELLNDLLDLSQVEAGKLVLDLRPISMSLLVDEVVASLEPAAEEKSLAMSLESAAEREIQVLVDRRRLRQILVNVIGNAIKFTQAGSIAIRLLRQGADAVVDIADTGLGIAPAHVERLFEPFSQADASIGQRFGGSGLGLALARRLAREMGGELALQKTAPEQGAVFRLTLPEWHAVGPSPLPEMPASTRPALPSLHGVRILLVDDYEDIRAPLAGFLRMSGAAVEEAADGETAIAMGSRGDVDVILMDIRMPGVNGIEASRRLRGWGNRVPIIALTADVVAQQQDGYDEAGFIAQLTKPVDNDRLVALIAELAR